MRRWRRTVLPVGLLALAANLTACVSPNVGAGFHPARPWPEADALFRRDLRWLGADVAHTIRLDPERILWLFGDTFVDPSGSGSRMRSRMIRNSVAVQEGVDPLGAAITFAWGREADGSPASFFPDAERRWYWPGHGIRLPNGPLVIFLLVMVETPGRNLGFASVGHALAIIDQPDAPVTSWSPRIVEAETIRFDWTPATAVVLEDEYVVTLALRQEGTHAGTLVRYPAASLAVGDLAGAEWWSGERHGWVPERDLGDVQPAVVLDDAGAECSIHWDAGTRSYVHVASYGFGDTTIGVRRAEAITGPWSGVTTVYRPPESDGDRPFVYAAKAHAALSGPDERELVITYVTNSFDFEALLTPEGQASLYWPRFVTVRLGR